MIVIELADSEARVLLKLAQQRFQTLDKQPGIIQSRNFDEYQSVAGAVSVLERELNLSLLDGLNTGE